MSNIGPNGFRIHLGDGRETTAACGYTCAYFSLHCTQEEGDSAENVRRPFDRERDLQLPQNVITPAKRQALMKDSAAALKNKFSHGSQRFL